MDAIWTLLAVLLAVGVMVGILILILKGRVGSIEDLLVPEEFPTEPVLVAEFTYRHEAEMALGYLKDAGINAAIFADDAGGVYAFSVTNPVRVMVSPEQADEAQSI